MLSRIMVLNDRPEILELFCELLTDEGHDVMPYLHPIQDLAEVERVGPVLIILDVLFGAEATGWHMLGQLKMRPSTEAIPVIICTAAANELQEREEALRAQGVRIVVKPFNVDDLMVTIEQALRGCPRTSDRR